MALEQWQPGVGPIPLYPVGAVIFDTTLPGGLFRSYHTMIVRPGASRSRPDGTIEFPIADMTINNVRWPGDNAWHQMHAECYVGVFYELAPEDTRQALEELWTLRTDPRATGKEIYTLAVHGVWQDDPNAPGEYLPGIRCSCASLIEHCYETIGHPVDLVRKDCVPPISAKDLWQLLGAGSPFREKPIRHKLSEWGLESQSEPWKVLLPAYQMRAFGKPFEELDSYIPLASDHPYP